MDKYIEPGSPLYTNLYTYIQNGFDARPSTTVKVIETLSAIIESLVNEIEEGKQQTISTKGQLS